MIFKTDLHLLLTASNKTPGFELYSHHMAEVYVDT